MRDQTVTKQAYTIAEFKAALIAKQKTSLNPKCCLFFSQTYLSADYLYKQFRPNRSGPTKCKVRSGSKLFNTMNVFLKEILKNVNFEKKSANEKKIMQICPRCKNFINQNYLLASCPLRFILNKVMIKVQLS